jgi:hypothetical protein
MNFARMMKRYLDEAGGDPAPGGAPAPAAPAAAPAAPATPAPSLLASGAAPGEPGTTDFIPEKLRVMKDDGTLDIEASSRKMADAYGALEKKMGTPGAAPPKDASEYTITVPDALKDAFDPATDEGMKGFLAGALGEGMTQKQVDFVMAKYFEMAPKLVAGAVEYDTQTATTELKKTWATDADFKRNVKNAYTATSAAAQKAGLDVDEIMSGPLRNNPQFLRLMAALGPEFEEDPGAGGMTMTSQEDINAMLSSEAYANPKHVDHAKVSEKIRQYYIRKHGTEAAA